jgi:hypothetical protein
MRGPVIVCLLVSALVAAPTYDALAQGKPEIKGSYFLYLTPGQTQTFTLYGDNLTPKEVTTKPPLTVKLVSAKPTEGDSKPKGTTQVTLEAAAPASCPLDTFDVTLVSPNGEKAAIKLVVAPTAPQELPIKRPANAFAAAMPLPSLPIAVTGTLNGDQADYVRFEAKGGEKFEILLLAGRAGSLLDANVRVRNSRRVSLALSAGMPSKDRRILFTAPADGPYCIEIADDQARGGAGYAYRLLVRRSP